MDAISFLLEVTPELTSNAKASALIVAADNGQVEAVRLLWQKTPDIALPFLMRAQSIANAKNHLDVVALLSNPSSLENRIDIKSNSIQKR